MADTTRIRDVIVVGSGPAGYTAAIYTARAGLDTLVIEGHEPGGALVAAGDVDNYPGVGPFVSGPALADAMRRQAQDFGAKLRRGYVDRFHLGDEHKTVSIRDAQHHGRALILAMGSAPRPLNVPGERGLLGHGVSTSAKRDGAQFTGRDVAVIGGGEGAIEEALHLVPLARHVTLIHHRPRLRASAIAVARLRAHPNVAILTSTEVLAVNGGQHVTGVRVRDTRHAGDSTIAVGGRLRRCRPDAVLRSVDRTRRPRCRWPHPDQRRYDPYLRGGRIRRRRPDRPPLPPSSHRRSERLRGRTRCRSAG